jgi:polysaccharide biosynthesis protein VpsQ
MPDAPASQDAPGGLDDDARPLIGPAVWWFGLAATVLVTAVLSLLSYAQGMPAAFDEVPQLDKALHFGLGGSLAFFLDGALRRRALRVGPVSLPLASVLLLVPAGIEEFLQRFSTYRTSSIADFAADVAGVTLFIWLSRRVSR